MLRTTFADIAAAALARSESLVMEWLPHGRRVGCEWQATNPTRNDTRRGSFSVNLRTGKWGDFASGDKGGDLVSLLAYLRGCTQAEAAEELANRFGMAWGSGERPKTSLTRKSIPTPAPARERSTARNVATQGTPSEPAPETFAHRAHGRPSNVWRYDDAQDRPVGYAVRFDKPAGKVVVPLSWTGNRWDWKAMSEPRPLYRLPKLLANETAVVIVVEGEKAADAAQALLREAAVTTWAGGAQAWSRADWQPIRGRRVILWPDADSPGIATMDSLRNHLLEQAGAASVAVVDLPPGLPPKWDAADVEPAHLGRDFALRLLAGQATAPVGCCPLCWGRGILAPAAGPTCQHGTHAWPDFPAGHSDHSHPSAFDE